MAPAPRFSLLLLLFLLFPAAGNAAAPPTGGGFNITEILEQFPNEFGLFNFLLCMARLAGKINSRWIVTILAPQNTAVDWLLRRSARLPRAALVELLCVHVVLDYLDVVKLAHMRRGRATVATTLYQTTGLARNRAGFLTVTKTGGGVDGVVFASAAPGALINATFVMSVAARTYNISVLQVSNFIVPPGVINRPRLPPPPPRMSSMAIAPSPAPTPSSLTPPTPALVPPADPYSLVEPEPDMPPAPAPSHGDAVRVMSWVSGVSVALGTACMLDVAVFVGSQGLKPPRQQ